MKYLISFDTYQLLVTDLLEKMKYDSFGEQGKYNIVSLYFDSDDHIIYCQTRDKLRFRQKLRLRIYGNTSLDDDAFLEIKQKNNKVVNKRRTVMKLREAYRYIDHTAPRLINVSNRQIMSEIDSFKTLYQLKPEMIVSYDRQAFTGVEDKDLRITFDYNLQCRKDSLRVEDGPHGLNFVDPNLVILEVKVSHSVPLWLTRLLSYYACSGKRVSKYCTSFDLVNNRQNERISL